MNIKRTLKFATVLGAGALLVAAAFLTRSAGRGQCPQCSYSKDLHACKHCGWTACLACWQAKGKYTCPHCGRGNP